MDVKPFNPFSPLQQPLVENNHTNNTSPVEQAIIRNERWVCSYCKNIQPDSMYECVGCGAPKAKASQTFVPNNEGNTCFDDNNTSKPDLAKLRHKMKNLGRYLNPKK